jgi:predicted Fe-Mo cluster-binding NifX family protein
MDKRIAVPVDENGTLDAHFGHCKFFALIDVENGKVVEDQLITPPPHEPGLLPRWLAEKKVTDILAGGMGQKAINLFNQHGVNAYVGAPKLSAQELAKGFLSGELNFSANYCDH